MENYKLSSYTLLLGCQLVELLRKAVGILVKKIKIVKKTKMDKEKAKLIEC